MAIPVELLLAAGGILVAVFVAYVIFDARKRKRSARKDR